jgi:hypothetical protein
MYEDKPGLPGQPFLERYALAVMYYATGGPDWEVCNEVDPECSGDLQKGWISPSNVCDWYRVSCDAGGRITSIDFNVARKYLQWTVYLETLET